MPCDSNVESKEREKIPKSREGTKYNVEIRDKCVTSGGESFWIEPKNLMKPLKDRGIPN